MNTSNQAILLTLLTGAIALALPGCASNPATGGVDVTVMGKSTEISLGEEEHQKIMDQGLRYDDEALQAYVERVGQRLASNSDRPDLKFTFTVLDSPDINAMALPGGFIYINRGLLAFLDSEAELAGVLGHEIGHVTARHAARKQTSSVTSQVLATTAYIITGSGDVYDASRMYGAELISGYGRDYELEADGLGAQYMHKSGYDPDALLEVIGVLKDQEQYQRIKAKQTGQQRATYHGLYASHPRNDQRLQTVVGKASELELDEQVDNPEVPGEFKRRTEGLVWGESNQDTRAPERYYHNKLEFTFIEPEGWTVTPGSRAIVAAADDGSATLKVTLRRREPAKDPKAVIESVVAGDISEGAALEQAGLKGYTAIASSNGLSARVAAINFNSYTYMMEGKAANFAAADATFLDIIESFRPQHPREKRTGGAAHYIHYIQVPRGATMATLAASIKLPDAETQLRLLNGLYPRGEPRTGDWIKVIR